jgi:hypothetical protein
MSSGLRDEYVSHEAMYPATVETLSSMLWDIPFVEASLLGDCAEWIIGTLKREIAIRLRRLWSCVRGRNVICAERTDSGKGFIPTSMDDDAVDCFPVNTFDNIGAIVSCLA